MITFVELWTEVVDAWRLTSCGARSRSSNEFSFTPNDRSPEECDAYVSQSAVGFLSISIPATDEKR